MVPLPAPEGPSIAMRAGRRLAARGSRLAASRFAGGVDRTSAASLTLLLSRAMRVRRRAIWSAAGGLFVVCCAAFALNPYLRGASFVVQAAGIQGFARTLSSFDTEPSDERELTVPWR